MSIPPISLTNTLLNSSTQPGQMLLEECTEKDRIAIWTEVTRPICPMQEACVWVYHAHLGAILNLEEILETL